MTEAPGQMVQGRRRRRDSREVIAESNDKATSTRGYDRHLRVIAERAKFAGAKLSTYGR